MLNKNITIAVVFVLVVGLGVYVYQDIKKRGVEAPQTPSPASSVGIQSTGDYTIKQIPIENPGSKVPTPNLNRALSFSGDLSTEAKKILTDNIKHLSDNLKKDSSQWNDWLELGIQRKVAGDYEGAREIWEYAAVLAPESYVPWNNLGDLYAHYLKDYSKAEQNFKKALILKPDYIGGYRALYELYRYSYKEKANLAPQILKDGLAKNPKSTDLMVLLAQYYKETGDKTQARSYYNKALNEFNKTGNTSMSALIQQELNNL
ncbi:MAG: hypothetical protein HZB09_00250 [Candidatus Yonathbacteria bacterium]|nr:hypothetical protein [Candidatus Yonathbacteria bacterium]